MISFLKLIFTRFIGQEEKDRTEDEMVGYHHRLNGHELEQTPGDGDGQGSLMCCCPLGYRVGCHVETAHPCCMM